MDEEKKYEEVSEQNQPEKKPMLPEIETPKLDAGLSQEDKDRLELARKKAEAVMPYQQIEKLIKTQAAGYAPETEEQRKERERREKSRKIIGAVTDGLSALGNLFFTSRYAPNMYNPEQSQLAAVNRWADKLKAEREARRDRYEALQGKLGDLAINKARTVREIEAAHEQQKIARERARREEEEAKRRAKMFEPQYQEALSKAEGAGYDTQAKKAAADAAPEQQRLKTENLGLEGQVKKSQIYKNTQQGKNAGNGGSKGKGGTVDGVYYENFNDYVNAITRKANEVNMYFAEKDANGKAIKDKDGNFIYRDGYTPVVPSYENFNQETKYYEWGETAGELEDALAKMRKEQNANKKNGSWSLKSENKGNNGGRSLK